MTGQFIVGFLLSVLIGGLGYWRLSLTASVFAGAVLVGTVVFGFGGWVWGGLLIVFFVLSSALSHYKAAAKVDLAEKFDKGHRRDLGQTFDNGGAGALIAAAFLFYPKPLLLAAFVGAMATVNADTWATELGVLSKRPPRLITTWRVVEAGSSGGISFLGTMASLSGVRLYSSMNEPAARRAPKRRKAGRSVSSCSMASAISYCSMAFLFQPDCS